MKIKFDSTKVTIIDKIWEKTILKLFPQNLEPNHLTVLRFLLIPVVVFLIRIEQYAWGGVLFVFAALTDTWDGALARTRNKITEWGKVYDPLADKLLIGTVVLFVLPLYLNFYVILVIILLEVMLVLEAIYLKKVKEKAVSALPVGKIKMVLQSFAVSFFLLHLIFPWFWVIPLASALIYLSIAFALASLFIYKSI